MPLTQLGDMLKLPSHVVRIMRGSLQPEVRDISFVPPTTVSSILSVAQKASPGIGASRYFVAFILTIRKNIFEYVAFVDLAVTVTFTRCTCACRSQKIGQECYID